MKQERKKAQAKDHNWFKTDDIWRTIVLFCWFQAELKFTIYAMHKCIRTCLVR